MTVYLPGQFRHLRFILGDNGPDFPNNYALLFAVSGTMFVITIPITLLIRELPGGKPQEVSPPMREYLPLLGTVLREDHPFRLMVLVRGLYWSGAPSPAAALIRSAEEDLFR